MNKKIKVIIFFIFSVFFLNTNISAEIKFKEVVVTGVGQSLEEATNNAFAEAISMVNGKNVQTKTIIKVLSGEEVPKEAAKEENSNFFAKILVQLSDKSKETEKKEEPKKEEDKKPEYSQKFIKELIDETKGGIKSYEILKKKKIKKAGTK